MKRFRLTLLLVCLVLLWLGYNDLSLLWRNRTPAVQTLDQLVNQGPAREWVTIEGGYMIFDEAISTSGTLDLEALLVPLKRRADQQQADIFVETRDPQLLSLFSEYHFQLDSEKEQARFRGTYADRFVRPRKITGMIIDGMTAESNRGKLLELAGTLGIELRPDTVFVAEGKEPNGLRGYLFLGAALLGLVRFIRLMRSTQASAKVGVLAQ